MTHDHARPAAADQRAVLATARAVLTADPDAAHAAAGSGACDECTTVAAVQFGFALAAELAGAGFASGPLRARLLAAITSAEAELRGTPN
jgi:hypothetical protein